MLGRTLMILCAALLPLTVSAGRITISSRLNHSSTDVTLRYLDITKDQVNETYQNYQF